MAPLVIAGIVLGAAKLLGGLFGSAAKKKQAEALRKAQQDALAKQTATWNVQESRRSANLNGIQGAIQKTQGSLAPGAPDYSFDPAVLAKMQEARPFPGSLPADPNAGIGFDFLKGQSDAVGDIASSYISGTAGGGAGSLLKGLGTSSVAGQGVQQTSFQPFATAFDPNKYKFTQPTLR